MEAYKHSKEIVSMESSNSPWCTEGKEGQASGFGASYSLNLCPSVCNLCLGFIVFVNRCLVKLGRVRCY